MSVVTSQGTLIRRALKVTSSALVLLRQPEAALVALLNQRPGANGKPARKKNASAKITRLSKMFVGDATHFAEAK